jgi:hypothetical protein
VDEDELYDLMDCLEDEKLAEFFMKITDDASAVKYLTRSMNKKK